jgi:serine phosphatase RsbU (regulator of sigma subunit)
MQRKPIPLYRSLVVNITLLLLILGGAIFAIMYYNSQRQIETLSRTIVQRTLLQTRSELDRFFKPVTSSIGVAYYWAQQDLFDTQQTQTTFNMLAPVIRQFPQISSILLADEEGNEFMLLREQGLWQIRQILNGKWNGKARIRKFSDEDTNVTTEYLRLEYDARKRPWFRGALRRYRRASAATKDPARQGLFWTEPYTFFTTHDPGITASIAQRDKHGRLYVLGIDILLNDISEFTSGLKVSPHGLAMILTDDGRVVGLPASVLPDEPSARKQLLLQRPDALGDPVVEAATSAYATHAYQEQQPFRFTQADANWWGGIIEYPLSPSRKLISMVLVPERDVSGDLRLFSAGLILLFGSMITVTALRIRRLAHRYSRPVEALVADSYQISLGNLDTTTNIKTNVMEVQQLAQAHNSMRAGLRNLLKMERDMQVAHDIQKRFLPTQLPELHGYQIASWYASADATGGDTYDVIGLKPSRNANRLNFTQSNPQQILLMLADATGHGIGPALTATQVRSMLRMALLLGCELPDMIRYLNQQLFTDLHSGRFITLWLGLLDGRNHVLRSYSAGQAPLLYFRAAANAVEVFDADAPPLGILEDIPIAEPVSRSLETGDCFLAISDGVYEAKNAQGEAFGVDRVKAIIQAHQTASAQQLLRMILDALNTFTHAARAVDDRTALIIKRVESE